MSQTRSSQPCGSQPQGLIHQQKMDETWKNVLRSSQCDTVLTLTLSAHVMHTQQKGRWTDFMNEDKQGNWEAQTTQKGWNFRLWNTNYNVKLAKFHKDLGWKPAICIFSLQGMIFKDLRDIPWSCYFSVVRYFCKRTKFTSEGTSYTQYGAIHHRTTIYCTTSRKVKNEFFPVHVLNSFGDKK